MSDLSTRPPQPVVGIEMPHESADLHVTGLALYTDDLVSRYPGTLHAYPVQAPHAHAQIRALDTAPALASGCEGAAIALVERSLAQATTLLGAAPTLRLHGGGAATLRPLLPAHDWVPDAVLRGLARWHALAFA